LQIIHSEGENRKIFLLDAAAESAAATRMALNDKNTGSK
jgi:hypothetical protein